MGKCAYCKKNYTGEGIEEFCSNNCISCYYEDDCHTCERCGKTTIDPWNQKGKVCAGCLEKEIESLREKMGNKPVFSDKN